MKPKFKIKNALLLKAILIYLLSVLPIGKKSMAQNSSYLNMNGVMWFYNIDYGTPFTTITSNLAALQNNGINIIGIYSPYNGNPDWYLGAVAVDFYDVYGPCGTLADWDNMIDSAHARGMKVIAWFADYIIDSSSAYFDTAKVQYKAGNTTAPECASFAWSETGTDNFPSVNLSQGVQSWVYSPEAEAYYWLCWDAGPHLNFNGPEGINFASNASKFWLDHGLDGFMYDVGHVMHQELKPVWITLPQTYVSRDMWLSPEYSDASTIQNDYNYGYNCWFNYADDDAANDYSRIITGAINADGLETALQNSNWAHASNSWTYAFTLWTPPSYTEANYVQEAALLAGAGITYGCNSYEEFYAGWSSTQKANWGKVLKAVNDNAALLPSASRTRLPITSSNNQQAYAMKRVSADGLQTALLIYNFQNSTQSVTVNLTGSGILAPQTPLDLYNGGNYATSISSDTSYTVSLPAYGFALLSVSSTPSGLGSSFETHNVEVFPNPVVEDIINIISDVDIKEISVFNHTGQKIDQSTINGQTARLITSGYNKGMYLLKIQTKKGIVYKKVIIE